MMRSFCILYLFFLVASSAAAQYKRPGLIIHSNLFSLLEPDGGPSLGFEYRASLHWAVVLEGTALLYRLAPGYGNNGRGFRIQPEVRYYFAGRHRTFRGFFSLQATYKEKTYQDSAFVLVDNSVGGIPDYDQERVYYEEKKQVLAGAANIGFQARFGKAQHFMIEMYAGLGLKQKDFYGRPAAIIDDRVRLIIPDLDQPGGYPHIAMGVRMGYCF